MKSIGSHYWIDVIQKKLNLSKKPETQRLHQQIIEKMSCAQSSLLTKDLLKDSLLIFFINLMATIFFITHFIVNAIVKIQVHYLILSNSCFSQPLLMATVGSLLNYLVSHQKSVSIKVATKHHSIILSAVDFIFL